MKTWTGLVVAALAACAGPAQQAAGPVQPSPIGEESAGWSGGRYPEGIAADTHVVAVVSGPSEDVVARLADEAFVRAVWGATVAPASARIVWPTPVERREMRSSELRVLRAWPRQGLADALASAEQALATEAALPMAPPSISAQVAREVRALELADARVVLCEATVRVAPASPRAGCDDRVAAREAARKSLGALGARVRLDVQPANGVPIGRDGRALRPATIVASLVGTAATPFDRLPLLVHAPEGVVAEPRLTTNESGRATLNLLGPSSQPIAVAVDREALLGASAASAWESPAVPIKLRVLSKRTASIAIAVTVTSGGDAIQGDAVAEGLRKDLVGRGFTVVSARPSSAEEPGADVTVAIELACTFASGLAGRSLWYEASARAVVTNAWTGAVVADVRERAQAAGLGEMQASRRAVDAVAPVLANRVHEALLAALGADAPAGHAALR